MQLEKDLMKNPLTRGKGIKATKITKTWNPFIR